MEGLKIILMAVLGAAVYGILHDLVTAHLCTEYFSEFHPNVFHTQDPILLALGWGVLATFWAGFMIGLPMALIARLGASPPLSWRRLLAPMLSLLGIMGLCALAAGWLGWNHPDWVLQFNPNAQQVVAERGQDFMSRFGADLAAHNASYFVGFIGGIGLWALTIYLRWGPANAEAPRS